MRRDIGERIVRQGDVDILLREAEIQEGRFTRYTAELSLCGRGEERAVVDTLHREEYPVLVAAAIDAFAASVRLRGGG